MVIAEVPMSAACDFSLSKTALRLLVYLGGIGQDHGGWSWLPLKTLAKELKTSTLDIQWARRQLLTHGYIQKRKGVVLEEGKEVVHYGYCVKLAEIPATTLSIAS